MWRVDTSRRTGPPDWAARTISDLESRYAEVMHENDHLRRIAECLINRLVTYENASSLPSTNSLNWKNEKKAEARQNGGDPVQKKAGGVNGHKGTSRKHAPERRKHHTFRDLTPEYCGDLMILYDALIRDIVEIPLVWAFEVCYIIDRMRCLKCGRVVEADSDLFRQGSYGKNLIGTMAVMRSLRVPIEDIVSAIGSIFGYRMTAFTVNNMLACVDDALETSA